MNLEGIGAPIALIRKNNDKKEKGTLVCIADKGKSLYNPMKEIQVKNNEAFQPIPDPNTERNVLYVTGQSGSGKSVFTKKYADEYKLLYPKREVFLFSCLKDDSSIDKIKGLKRINLSPELLNADIGAEDFKDSLVIFDDIDTLMDKKMKAKITGILNSLLETSRHYRTSIIYTSHLACKGSESKTILNEAHSVIVFPRGCGNMKLKYLLENYFGLDKHQIAKIKNTESRWVCVNKTFPMSVVTEKEAYSL
jgi:hypothetical protein